MGFWSKHILCAGFDGLAREVEIQSCSTYCSYCVPAHATVVRLLSWSAFADPPHEAALQGPDVRGDWQDAVVPHPAANLRNLVLVAGHSVFVGLDFQQAENISSWYLLDYQKVRSCEASSLM